MAPPQSSARTRKRPSWPEECQGHPRGPSRRSVIGSAAPGIRPSSALRISRPRASPPLEVHPQPHVSHCHSPGGGVKRKDRAFLTNAGSPSSGPRSLGAIVALSLRRSVAPGPKSPSSRGLTGKREGRLLLPCNGTGASRARATNSFRFLRNWRITRNSFSCPTLLSVGRQASPPRRKIERKTETKMA